MKPLKTRNVASPSLRKGRDERVAFRPLKKSLMLLPRPPGSLALASSASVWAICWKRSRRKMAGRTPSTAAKTPMPSASVAAPWTWSWNQGL